MTCLDCGQWWPGDRYTGYASDHRCPRCQAAHDDEPAQDSTEYDAWMRARYAQQERETPGFVRWADWQVRR